MPRTYQGPLQPGKRSAYVPGTRFNRYSYRKPRGTGHKKLVPASTKSSVRSNTTAIKSLQGKVNGHIQRGYHICKIVNQPTTPNAFNWQPNKPILFALNDMYTTTTAPGGGPGAIYYPLYSGTSPNITMSGAVLSRWVDYTPGEALGHTAQFQQWKDVKFSQPSRVGYQPLYTDVTVTVKRDKATPTQGVLWVRVDTFTSKRIYQASAGGSDPKIYNMPGAVGALSDMAVGANPVPRNSFNPALWSVKTRWIKLPAVNQDMQNLSKSFHIRCGFPKKFLSLNMDVDPSGVGEGFWQCCDPRAVKWCLISLSDYSVSQTTDPTPSITMSRKVVYRDSRGAQM